MKYLLLATVAAFALLSPAHAKDEPLPNPTMGSPGVARICLTDNDVHLRPKDEIVVPATTVFEDKGPNTGRAESPRGTAAAPIRPARFSHSRLLRLFRLTPQASNRAVRCPASDRE